MEKLFYEFDVAYKADNEDMLKDLGIDSQESITEKATIDITKVVSFHKSKQGPGKEWNQTTVELSNGQSYTLMVHYNEFKKILASNWPIND